MPPQAAESREAEATCTCRRWAWHRFFPELSRIKSVIGITYPKINFFWGPAPGRKIRRVIPPKAVVGSGRPMRIRRWGNGFLLMPPEFEGLYKNEENILRRPGHDKMKRPIDVTARESPEAGKDINPVGTD